ncbi:copper-binding protein [Indioceanicola profundi]|uniref:copper-binding protein n=1 Tax=Indioceanicola profundi TaxID=2220096 RepID=UPI00196972D0|nr:copper-binding protein [Indioceanicola profundi]
MNMLKLAAGAVALTLIAGGAGAHNHAGDKQDDTHHGMHQNMGHGDKAGAEGHSHHSGVVGTGTVRGVDAAKGTVKLAHGPIPALKWPAMVMDFKVAEGVDLSSLSDGQEIEFALGPDQTITSIKPKS